MLTRYVTKHASASDSNGGTNATTDAWATAIKGFTSISSGDTLVFGTGSYVIDRPSIACPIPSGIDANNHTIITDNADGTVTFTHPGTANRFGMFNFTTGAGKQYISWIGTSAYSIVFDANEVVNCGTIVYLSNGFLNSNFYFKNIEMKDAVQSAVLGGRTSDVHFENCYIHDNGSIEVANVPQDHGIYASGANLIVDGCILANNFGYGLQLFSGSGSNFTGRQISNNFIYNNGYGSGSRTISGMVFSEGSGTIYNNVFYKNAGHGIDVWRTSNLSIYHNSLHQNGLYGLNIGNGGGTSCTGTLIKNNIALENVSGDIQIRSNAVNTVLDFNRISGTSISNTGSNTTSTNLGLNATDTTEWVDPTNATLASRDYNLKTGASSIAPTGIASVGVTTDIEGTARNFIDQGAYAYGLTTPPDPPIIGHNATYTVTTEYGAVAVTITKGTNNVVECTISGTGAAALCVDHTDVTVVKV